MSTFYSSSTNQMDTTPNLCLGDPETTPYSDSSIPSNMVYLNYLSTGPYSDALAGNNQNQQTCVDFSAGNTIISQGSSIGNVNMMASRIGEQGYDGMKDGRNEMLLMQTVGNSINNSEDLLHGNDPQMSIRSQFHCLNGQNLSLQQADVSAMQNQGLSLSLGTQIPVSSFQYHPTGSDISFAGPHESVSANSGPFREALENRTMSQDINLYGLASATSSIQNSKYLKAAQELLEEIVNVRTVLKQKGDKIHNSAGNLTCKDIGGESKSEGNLQESTANSSSELSSSERHDLQNKATKLLAMLDEVDRRYKQYYHQMQIIVSSFDAIAGCGAAKPYTALALQTISRHFRCLRDAITAQVQTTRKTLGDQDSSTGKNGGLSRLRYIDQQLRQQRAMQQFGMLQQHAWRPQRGLPESSVSVLRAWLFEHFLHPYPKDSEKLILARQTGLTRGQVSNWFINARVRLWKPMIEEMYKEEMGDVEIDSNSSSENPQIVKDEGTRSSKDNEDLQSPITERCQTSHFSESSRSSIIPTADITTSVSGFQNEAATDMYMNMKVSDQRPGEDTSFLQDGAGRFMAYPMTELGPYGNSGVSLTLGLQHCDSDLAIPDNQQNFLTANGFNLYASAAPVQPEAADFDYASVGDRRHRFASSHLQHDFVA